MIVFRLIQYWGLQWSSFWYTCSPLNALYDNMCQFCLNPQQDRRPFLFYFICWSLGWNVQELLEMRMEKWNMLGEKSACLKKFVLKLRGHMVEITRNTWSWNHFWLMVFHLTAMIPVPSFNLCVNCAYGFVTIYISLLGNLDINLDIAIWNAELSPEVGVSFTIYIFYFFIFFYYYYYFFSLWVTTWS